MASPLTRRKTALKTNHENKDKDKIKKDLDSSSDEESNDVKLALTVRKTKKDARL